MNNEIITVITPTYNRNHTLNKCYESLLSQTNKSFIWTIVDDGSTDDTEKTVNTWSSEKKIPIKYLKKENGGKASALNYAFEHIDTEYFVTLDSDDFFSKDAIEKALYRLESIKNISLYAGVLALRTNYDNSVMGDKQIPGNVKDTTLTELTNSYKIRSEVIIFYKTEVIKNFKFPKFPNENFISPAYMEHEIGKSHRFLVSREIYCYCEYQPDGLTKNKIDIIKKNPKGYTLVIKQAYELSDNFLIKCKHGLMYIAGSLLSKEKKIINNSPNKLMTIILYPLGWLAYKIRFGK